MKKFLPLFLLSILVVYAQYPSGESILERIDQNMSSETRVITSKMVVHGRRSSRTIESKSWVAGEERSFTEYISPAREKGTKMLMLEDNLWIYSPTTDRIIQISGHMLKQSLMGSDLSYEDMMEDPKLRNHYNAEVTGEETIDERSCWVLELTANTKTVAYHKRKMWVDKQRSIPLREELYAKSGKLLKKTDLKNVINIKGRWFPKKIIFKDMLKKGDGTEFIIETIEFDVDIPGYKFSKAALRR
ncbi:MAG: outer membrane lipoprotein-sorting protein [Candidatus Marinimicrobia bacterium]|nr:outer membrane lipoprotein-sorting protein [Candidatus Neomarinimicrobiota bacterium]